MIILTPQANKPSCLYTTTVNGRTTSGSLVLPEAFVINGAGVHLVTTGPSGPVYAGTGAWSQQDGAVVYKCNITASPALRYETVIMPRGDKIIEWAMTFRNLSGVTWDEWSHANAHFSMDQAGMQDTDGARTYVVDQVTGGLGLVPINTTTTVQPSGPYAGQWGFHVSNPKFNEAANVHFPLVARRSADFTQWAGVAADTASTVGGNMNQGCIHANPKLGPLASNAVKTVRGRVMLDEATGGAILLGGTLALYD